jgi:hypothetical protein
VLNFNEGVIMENFETYVKEVREFLEEYEKFSVKGTKASANRLCRHINAMGRVKVQAKRELKASLEE